MSILRFPFAVVAAALLSSCGGGGGDAGPETATFAFRMRGLGPAEEFRVASTSPEFIAQARAQLALPPERRRMFAAGSIRGGDGGVNPGWSWHFTGDVALAEMSIELCDGRPSMVEADLSYWLRRVKSFCPWGSYVFAEVP